MLEVKTIRIEVPKECNVILGMAHFINSVPKIKFGIGFCESSGPCLVRSEGNDEELKNLVAHQALEVGCGHCFIIFLKNAYPINVLDKVKQVPEVCNIHAATANSIEVLIAETEQGRGILGVIDGSKSKGIETEKDAKARKNFLRKVGYKL
jgi:adenosine/AMP kinase